MRPHHGVRIGGRGDERVPRRGPRPLPEQLDSQPSDAHVRAPSRVGHGADRLGVRLDDDRHADEAGVLEHDRPSEAERVDERLRVRATDSARDDDRDAAATKPISES